MLVVRVVLKGIVLKYLKEEKRLVFQYPFLVLGSQEFEDYIDVEEQELNCDSLIYGIRSCEVSRKFNTDVECFRIGLRGGYIFEISEYSYSVGSCNGGKSE